MASTLIQSFLAALQAALSVLLTILYGVIAAQFKLLSEPSSKDISKICVRLFLPALLIANVGSELQADTALRYVPILIWALIYNFTSLALGLGLKRVLKLPGWIVPAIAFNNTTSLPLLLIKALASTGILETLLASETDTPAAAVKRAQSYFLVNSVVSNVLTFSLGPKLLDGEEAPDKGDQKAGSDAQDSIDSEHVERGQQDGSVEATEETSLLPDALRSRGQELSQAAYGRGKKVFATLPPWAEKTLEFSYTFINAPMIGAVIGVIVGLAPPLHRVFFDSPKSGGIFTAWLTASIENIGDLFAALQVVVVGVKLSHCLRKMKAGEESGNMPWLAAGCVLLIRFVIWPAIAISSVFVMARNSGLLSNDPLLWFCLMLMPTGPPALLLIALADVNNDTEAEKMTIAKFLTLSYSISPIISFAVVGSLKACEAVAQYRG